MTGDLSNQVLCLYFVISYYTESEYNIWHVALMGIIIFDVFLYLESNWQYIIIVVISLKRKNQMYFSWNESLRCLWVSAELSDT